MSPVVFQWTFWLLLLPKVAVLVLIINENNKNCLFLVHCFYTFCRKYSIQHNINTKKWEKLTWQCEWIQLAACSLACLFLLIITVAREMQCRKANSEESKEVCVCVSATALWNSASVWFFTSSFSFNLKCKKKWQQQKFCRSLSKTFKKCDSFFGK